MSDIVKVYGYMVFENMGAFVGEYAQSGRFIDGAGLSGSKHRTRLVFRGGQRTINVAVQT